MADSEEKQKSVNSNDLLEKLKSRNVLTAKRNLNNNNNNNNQSTAIFQSASVRNLPTLGQLKVKKIKEEGYLKNITYQINNDLMMSRSLTSLTYNPNNSQIDDTKQLDTSTNSNNSFTLHLPTNEHNNSHTNTTFLSSLKLNSQQQWDLQHVPNTFYYMRLKDKNSNSNLVKNKNNISPKRSSTNIIKKKETVVDFSDSVYDLEIVTQNLIDKSLYFTLSKEGVTMFHDKSSHFTSMSQWEREYALYHKIANIKFFKLYKLWKQFSVLKNYIRSKKRTDASESLKEKLFIFSPPLRSALLKVKRLSLKLAEDHQIISLERAIQSNVFNLDEFILIQQQVHDKLRIELDNLSAIVLNSVRGGCDEVVDMFLKANNIAANHKMTFMERAALRAECKRLTRFLRMVDLIMNDFLLGIVTTGVTMLGQALRTSEEIIPIIERDAAADMTTIVANRKESESTTPLFRVVVNFKKKQAGEMWEDSLIIRPTLDQLTKRIYSIIASSLDVVNKFVKVYQAHETEIYVMPEGDEDAGVSNDSEKADLATVIRGNVRFSEASDLIFANLRHSYAAVREYVHVFDSYRQLYFNNQVYVNDISSTFAEGTIQTFLDSISHYRKMVTSFKDIPKYADVGALFVDSAEMKGQLTPSPNLCIDALKAWIPQLAIKRAQELLDEVGYMNPIISSEPATVEAYVNKKKTKDTANENLELYKDKQDYVRALVNLLDENTWEVPDSLKALIRMLKESIISLETNIQTADGREEDETKRFSLQVAEECPKLLKKIAECREQLDAAIVGDPDTPDEKVIKYLSQIEIDFLKLRARVEKVQDYQGILRLPVDDFDVLNEVQSDLSLKTRLWTDKAEWSKLRDRLMDTQIADLDVSILEKELARYNKTLFLASKGLPTSKVVPRLKSSVEELNPVLPVVIDLRNPALKDRHWDKIYDLIKVDIKNETDFSLTDLINEGVTKYQEDISIIATAALQESILEEMMLKVTTIWEKLEFEVKPYKDVKDLYILGDVTEVTSALDDSLVTVNTVLGSRYVAGIRSYVDTWRTRLMLFQETLDEWLTCQRNWMYLETIFGSPDIVKQLPGPAKVFQAVDKSWKLIMKQTNDDRNALKATTNDKGRRDIFRAHNANLDQIQKDLEDYLETKRMSFPRFYFLSNDELLEILSQAKDPRAVQPHLRKCFDNLVKLEFGNVEEGSGNDILAMYSSENERVSLGKNLKARGAVEEWLTAVEKKMKESLTTFMKAGLVDYDAKSRDEWIFLHPGQVVATVAQMTWARGTESSLRAKDSTKRMIAWFNECKNELQKLIVKIRGSLSKLHRSIIVALVTTDVHARDIIDELVQRKVDSIQDFVWQQQLRYYWESSGISNSSHSASTNALASDQQETNCFIHHSDARIAYGYEYMGATSRLVITPLTDRCWLTLTGSFALKLGAAPAGPAGTGKTESSKDLAKAMAIQCVVFNCSDQIDYKMMGKLFRGLAQGGAWVCLDEFNRIDIEVLSVIAQQLLVLREGRIAAKSHINFMGITIPLVDHHVIITMNPGYAGRTELPDNLQVCFRPVSMMVPNYALIAEIMLFAEGFGDAKNLSQKMCKLYILCSEQLSQQPHYDYGLRAVKSVLVMAGSLKRANPATPEDLVLIRALRDSNVPKFLSDDLPLFAAIVQDLFPGVNIPVNDYGELQVVLEEELAAVGLQKVPSFMTKVIQLFDIFNIRFGATLVGYAGTGKTTCYKILASVMTTLREKRKSSNPEFQKVRIKVLNPKSISMGDLYGEFNPLTQEWHDGLASSIMREFVLEEDNDDRRWTVFDGPIDALWIENLNTVLDDNMTLCLANGQRIKLKNEMKCLFEVNDLAAASPATVSRIGVVYMSSTDLGYMPYVQSWISGSLTIGLQTAGLTSTLLNFIRERVTVLFKSVFIKGLQIQRKQCKEPIETVDIQQAISLCTLLESLMIDSIPKAIAAANNQTANNNRQDIVLCLIDRLFFFVFVWSVGASISYEEWELFSDSTREIFDEVSPSLQLPPSGLVFDYFVDYSALSNINNINISSNDVKFKEWSDVVPSFEFKDNVPYFNLMVPTVDTVRYFFVMQRLIESNKPCFVTGITGTGKTVAVQNLLKSLNPTTTPNSKVDVLPIFINFSAQTRSDVTQTSIESKLEKKRKNLLGAPGGKKAVVFVDDVNMPLVETYGAQPPVELLRQFLDLKGFYDREKLFWKDVVDVLLFAGASPPGGGKAALTQRFTRHFNVLCIPLASNATMTHIFSNILGGFLSSGTKFDPEIVKLKNGVVQSTIELYSKISTELLPTPAKFHYTFNLRDISKVFQGLLMIRSRKCSSAETFCRLWVHEVSRVFSDRLINTDDLDWFNKQVYELSTKYLKSSNSYEELFAKPIVFIDFLKPEADPRFYEEVKELPRLTAVLNDLLDQYNVTFPSQMNLVFFQDALTHTARISRVLRQPRGNAMLIGVGGSGKQSLTKMAAFVAGMACLSIEINRGYQINEFREDIKKFMYRTGVEGKETVFLFTDSQIVDETMLEDLNNVLNSGEVSNLFASDETDKIASDMVPICKAEGIAETRDNCLSHFVNRVRDKLHIVLCMSPVGDSLRIRCRQFTSLINCTTIDWFHAWPEAALVSVAERFLADLELPTNFIKESVVKMCGFVHRSIETASEKFYSELRRRVYTTPKSYLDLINLYINMLRSHQKIVELKSDRMKVGVRKLLETNSVVDGLKADLVKLEPVLKSKSLETESLLAQVAKDTAEANVVAAKVKEEESIVGKQAQETEEVAADAQKDLDKAMPALQSAVNALKSLTKADITEVKSFQNPPRAVQVVMEAVCVLLNEKENWDSAKKLLSNSNFMDRLIMYDKDNIPDPILKKLRKSYIDEPEMQPENIMKVSKAGLGLCLWARAMNVYADVAKEVAPKKARLDDLNNKLSITKAALSEKQSQLKEVMDRVALLQKTCDDTLAEKNRLQQESDVTAARLIRAEKLTSGLSSEGERWSQNIVLLAEERNTLIGDVFLSSACISYYGGFTGPYRDNLVKSWQTKILDLGIPSSGEKFSLVHTLGDPVQTREWQNQGLPSDPVSISNGILVDKCRRWPLMIDPQNQANQWIRKMEEKNQLQVTTMNDSNLLRVLETCIRLGRPLLLEDIGEQLEPALEPILLKAVFKGGGGRMLIRLGDSDVDYDAGFKLYMTTKLPNPHYLPEVCIKVTLINFTVTMLGLEAQLLGDVVKFERPDIEQRKVQLLLQMAEDKRQLQMLEAKILQMLSESEGNILDDEALINTLSESKITSVAISERVREAEITETEINEARGRYLPVATRGSLIYFVIADLGGIDPMYQYSLSYYSSLFSRCILESEKSEDLEVRLNFIIEYATLTIYRNICRGLFEKDKLLFSACICFAILRNAGEIHDLEWNLFVRGAGALDRSVIPAIPNERISSALWDLLFGAETKLKFYKPIRAGTADEKTGVSVSTVTSPKGTSAGQGRGRRGQTVVSANEPKSPAPNSELNEKYLIHNFSHPHPFIDLCSSITKSFDSHITTKSNENNEEIVKSTNWHDWIDTPSSESILNSAIPEPYESNITLFQKLILVKALREDRLLNAIASFVSKKLGQQFAVSPSSSMEDIYKDLDNKTPCIFILSTGADPTGMLLRFSKKMNYSDRLQLVSLGQGQGAFAKALIERGTKSGDWVVLQNCMLAKSWMPELDRIIFDIQQRATAGASGATGVTPIHPDFRLFLTSSPASYFPVAILQNGVKMTNEPPKGISNNLIRSFGNLVKEEDYEIFTSSKTKSLQWKKLLCGLGFFHANIQERRKFGPLGWNIRYAFDESDLETSVAVLKRFIAEQEKMPWEALNYVTGQINYGGRVTDDWDRRCLMAILSIYLTPDILSDDYTFSKSGIYKAPKLGSLNQLVQYFSDLPSADGPEVFGMHENADVAFNSQESSNLMFTLLSLQPRQTGGGSVGINNDDLVIELANSYEELCPEILRDEEAGPTTFVIQSNGLLTSLAICLSQEMIKFNRLLQTITSSLRDIKQAIRGFIVMSADLDSMHTAFLNNQVPSIWEKVSFASLKSLASWFKDLVFRVQFLRIWLSKGQPLVFPLPVFFFPQGFMTASLQTFARKHQEAIDGLSFKFNILSIPAEEITEAPQDGVIIHGLYLEGARYNPISKQIEDSKPGKMFEQLPAIHFIPEVNHIQSPNTFQCPVYKTALRKGVLSTTGMSTNFVVAVELPINPNDGEQKWILAGVAALLNLTD